MKASIIHDLVSKLTSSSASVLEELGAGTLTREKAYAEADKYFIVPENGVELVFLEENDEFCALHILLSQVIPEEQPYLGELPFALHSGMTREEVAVALGVPTASAGPQKIPVLGEIGGWDKFDLAGFPGVLCMTGYTTNSTLSEVCFATQSNF
jgi:hypothetical protein